MELFSEKQVRYGLLIGYSFSIFAVIKNIFIEEPRMYILSMVIGSIPLMCYLKIKKEKIDGFGLWGNLFNKWD